MKRKNFETIQEYIDYLIYEKNIINPKSICILLVVIGIIAILSLRLSKSLNSDFDWFEGNTITQKEIIETLLQAGYSEEELDKLSDEQLNSLFNRVFANNKGQTAGNNKYQEFPEQEASILKQDYYLKASKGDFDFITTDFEDKKIKYYFSASYNKELITIYNDAYYLKTITNNVQDSFKIHQVLSNIKDPQMLLYGTLLTEEKYRRDILVDKFSLSPILLKKQITFISSFSTSMGSINTLNNSEKDNYFNEMARYLNEGSYTFYKIKFYIDNNLLTAYMYKNTNDLKLSFYGIYSENNNDIYLRVYDFIQMQNTTINSSNTSSENIKNNTENNLEDTNLDSNDNNNSNNESNNSENNSDNNNNNLESSDDIEEELNLD